MTTARLSVAGATLVLTPLLIAGCGDDRARDNVSPQAAASTQPDKQFELPQADEFDYTLAADHYDADPKQLVLDFFDKRNAWANDLASRGGEWLDDAKTYVDDRDRGIATPDIAAILGKAASEAFIRDAIRPDWQSVGGEFTSQVDRWRTNTAIQSTYALQTTGRHFDEDAEPFMGTAPS